VCLARRVAGRAGYERRASLSPVLRGPEEDPAEAASSRTAMPSSKHSQGALAVSNIRKHPLRRPRGYDLS